jgi:hypothetical protein
LWLHFICDWFSIIILQILTTKNKVAHAVLVSWSSVVDLLMIVSLDVWWGPFVLPCGSPFLHWRICANVFAFLSLCPNLAVDLESCNLHVVILYQLFYLLVACWPRLCLGLPLHVFDAHSIPLSIQHDEVDQGIDEASKQPKGKIVDAKWQHLDCKIWDQQHDWGTRKEKQKRWRKFFSARKAIHRPIQKGLTKRLNLLSWASQQRRIRKPEQHGQPCSWWSKSAIL